MRRWRLPLSTLIAGALASACTAVVLKDLSDTDALPVVDASVPDECALVDDPDAGNPCSVCIASQCTSDVEYACTRGQPGMKSWWSDLTGCAQNPYIDYGPTGITRYGCAGYDTDAGPNTSTDNDDDAKRVRDSEICVRVHCISGATPACKLCPVNVDLPGVGGTTPLESDPCGACVRQACAAQIVRCCTSQIVSANVRYCGYTADPGYKQSCTALGTPSTATEPTGEDACDRDIRACYAGCAKTCQGSSP